MYMYLCNCVSIYVTEFVPVYISECYTLALFLCVGVYSTYINMNLYLFVQNVHVLHAYVSVCLYAHMVTVLQACVCVLWLVAGRTQSYSILLCICTS